MLKQNKNELDFMDIEFFFSKMQAGFKILMTSILMI